MMLAQDMSTFKHVFLETAVFVFFYLNVCILVPKNTILLVQKGILHSSMW